MRCDFNTTAGLEAKLSLAVGIYMCYVTMPTTKAGLINGAIGTVLSITVNHVTVQFDHICDPYNVEMVRSRFILRILKAYQHFLLLFINAKDYH